MVCALTKAEKLILEKIYPEGSWVQCEYIRNIFK